MKTTEIFVEQVLIGLLVLATGFLPYIPMEKIKELKEFNSLIEGAVIIAIAYLVGIVLDRFADTLLERLEQYHRLRYALDLIEEGKQHSSDDPYPEDRLQIKILKDSKETNERMQYLRSRMRLTRALAIFTPALTISGLLSLWQYKDNIPPGYIIYFLGGAALIYILCFICILVLSCKRYKLPKTYRIDIQKVKEFYKNNPNKRVISPIYIVNEKEPRKFSWCREPTTIAAGLLFLMMISIAVYYREEHALLVLLTGLGISSLAAWSWWRISATFMKFLMDCDKNNEGVKDAKTTDVKHENKDTLIGISKVNAKGVFYDD
ncbi:MAG: hypothetical protein HUU08_15055 [Candidatus Brocadia sp.]|nr:hypothetical protein [Candidatus Brocadia sp.]